MTVAVATRRRIARAGDETCQPGAGTPSLVIPFGGSGYVAFFGIFSEHEVVVAAIRQQREDDWR